MSNTNCNCNCPPNDYLPPCPDIPLPPPRPLPPCPPRPGCTPGCSDQTPNYGLPLWKASDVTSWLMQINGAMLRIDTIMHDLALRTGINGLPDDLVTCVSKLTQDVEVLKCTIGELGNKTASTELIVQNMNTQVAAIKTDLSSITINLTNLDTRLMTVDTKTENLENKMTLMRSDVNMIQQSINNLQSNMLQFQNTTNQELHEHSGQLIQLTNPTLTRIALSPSSIDLAGVTPENESAFNEILNKSTLSIFKNNQTGQLELVNFSLNFALTSPFSVNTDTSVSDIRIKLSFTGEGFPGSSLFGIAVRGSNIFVTRADNGTVALYGVPYIVYITKDQNELRAQIVFQASSIRPFNNIQNTKFTTTDGFAGTYLAYKTTTKDIEIEPSPYVEGGA